MKRLYAKIANKESVKRNIIVELKRFSESVNSAQRKIFGEFRPGKKEPKKYFKVGVERRKHKNCHKKELRD